MTTKQALRDLEHPVDRSTWKPCIVCSGVFDQESNAKVVWRQRRKIPNDVCAWCVTRGWPKFKRMMQALDDIANVSCITYQKGGTQSDDCKCPTCFAAKVYAELFEPEEEEAPSAVPEQVVDGPGQRDAGLGSHDHEGGVLQET